MKNPVDQLESTAYGISRGVGSKIEGTIFLDLSYDLKPGKGILNIESESRILFVIPQDDVIAREVLLDEIALKDESLLFVGREDIVKTLRPFHHQCGFVGKLGQGFEV